jgi:hypothetical protein
MTFKKYFFNSIILSALLALMFVFLNYSMNEYGLFGDVAGRSINIWHNERTSKYLLSYNYIPSNFEGVLVGPSVSANINTKNINKFKIYNLSITGGNITELKYITENIFNKKPLKIMVLCLYPYLTKDHGFKTSHISTQKYWGSFGSKETVVFYCIKFLIKMGLKHDVFNDFGYNNLKLLEERQLDLRQMEQDLNKNKQKINIDDIAYEELSELIISARKKNIKIFAFYFPYYIKNYDEKNFINYKMKIEKLFDFRDAVWDFNNKQYDDFRNNCANFYDGYHPSKMGSDFLTKEISDKINSTNTDLPVLLVPSTTFSMRSFSPFNSGESP